MTPPKRILVVRLSSLGDVVLITPVLENLKAAWPSARISVLVKKRYAAVFEGHPSVGETLIFESRGLGGWLAEFRRNSFDLFIDLHDSLRSRVLGLFGGFRQRVRYDKRTWARRQLVWFKRVDVSLQKNVVERYQESLSEMNVPVVSTTPKLYVSKSARLSSEWESRLGPGRFIGIAPGAAHGTKRWPAERFAQTADRLRSELEKSVASSPVKILLFGADSDEASAVEVLRHLRGPVLSLVGKTSIKELVLLVERCSVMITNDSGIMHISSALGVPTVAIFGPTVEAFGFFPPRNSAQTVQVDDLPCRPCSLHGTERCPLGHFRCMRDISVDHVLEAAGRVLKKAS